MTLVLRLLKINVALVCCSVDTDWSLCNAFKKRLSYQILLGKCVFDFRYSNFADFATLVTKTPYYASQNLYPHCKCICRPRAKLVPLPDVAVRRALCAFNRWAYAPSFLLLASYLGLTCASTDGTLKTLPDYRWLRLDRSLLKPYSYWIKTQQKYSKFQTLTRGTALRLDLPLFLTFLLRFPRADQSLPAANPSILAVVSRFWRPPLWRGLKRLCNANFPAIWVWIWCVFFFVDSELVLFLLSTATETV